jgi:hypothetical protein
MTTRADPLPGIRWWRVIGGGLLIEAALTVVSVPFVAMGRAADLQVIVPPLTLPVAFFTGVWVARRAASPVLNAALAGAIAIPLYVAIVIVALVAAPDVSDTSTALSPAYLAAHAFKVLAAAAGGWLVARRRS